MRFTNSGTEANMHALRIARAYTGKAKIIKTEGGYHGTTDVFEASVDPNIKKAGTLDQIKVIPESRGVSANALKDVLVTPFNDIERTRKMIEENHREVACIIIEPIMGSAGQITPDLEYLRFLREITSAYNIVLIFDEVVTGRLSTGGAQQYYGVTPGPYHAGESHRRRHAGGRFRRQAGDHGNVRPAAEKNVPFGHL